MRGKVTSQSSVGVENGELVVPEPGLVSVRSRLWTCPPGDWVLSGVGLSGFGLPGVNGTKGFVYLVCAAGSSCSNFPPPSLLYGYRNTTQQDLIDFGVFNPILKNLSSAWTWVDHCL